MKFNKKFLCTSIFSAIFLQISQPSNTVFANNINNNRYIYNILNKTNNDYKFSFLHSKRILHEDLNSNNNKKEFNQDLNNNDSSYKKFFNIYNDYPYFKIFINNTSDYYYNVVISNEIEPEKILEKFKINPHDYLNFSIPKNLYQDYENLSSINNLEYSSSGYYPLIYDCFINSEPFTTINVSITTESDHKLSGSITVRVSSTEDELNL